MVPASGRLTDDKDIKATIRKGRHLQVPPLHIYVVSGKTEKSRVACVVSKKTAKSAVTRHRYQRKMRHAARELMEKIDNPVDMVWIARPAMKDVSKTAQLVTMITEDIGLSHFDTH